MSDNSGYINYELPEGVEAFTSMYSDGREKVAKDAGDSVQKPKTAAAQGSSVRDGTQRATNQQFNSDGSVRRS